MKKICFSFNHFQLSDGVARSAIAMANELCKKENVEVVLRPIYKYNREAIDYVDKRVKVVPVFGFYFRGFSKIVNSLPKGLLHYLIFGNKYNVEIGFQHGTATIAVASSKNNSKHIIWIHGYDNSLSLKKYYLKVSQIVCVSKCNSIKLKKQLDCEKPKIDYCYNPINEKLVIQQGMEPIDISLNKEIITFVSVGRLSKEKGYSRLLDVVKRLKEEKYTFTLLLIGDGPEYNELLKKTNELQLNDCVIFVGSQANPHKYTAKSDVFICSSFTEGYSTACTEALMLGVPIITTNVGGAEEIIHDAKCGLIVDNDIDAIYNGMKKIIESPELVFNWKTTLNETKKNFYSKKRIEKLEKLLDL